MPWNASRIHLLGVLIAVAAAIVLLVTVIPYAARTLFQPPLVGYGGLRFELFYYLVLALIPVVFWLIPPFSRWLARSTHAVHRLFLGRSGFYVRFPVERPLRFRTTVLMALGPFALDMLAIVELEYFFGSVSRPNAPTSFWVAPPLILLAALITTLLPGGWLVDVLDIRLVNPRRGEVTREAAIFEGVLGPIGAVALLLSFITTLHEANYSYEAGLFALAVWAVRLFPPILAAVTVYRVVIEPDVLPSLRAWCARAGIPVREDVSRALEEFRRPPEASESTPDTAGPLEHSMDD